MGTLLGRGLALLVAALVGAFVYLYIIAPHTAYELALGLERRLAGVTEHQIEVDGFNIHYLEGGEGEPLLLLHGFGADKDNWTRLAGHLTDDYHVVAPDLPGFGESDRPADADYGIDAQVARVRAFVRALELGPAHVAGNSMGGGIAGAYAAAHPDAVRSLWLLAPYGVAAAPVSALRRRIAAGGDNPLLPRTHAGYYRLLDWVFVDPPWIPAPVKYVLAERAVNRRPLLAKILTQLNATDFDLAGRLSDSDVPTLILWGRQDRLLHPDGARILADALPRAETVLLDDTGHAPMIERPRVSAAAFTRFQSALAAGAQPSVAEPAAD